MTVDAGQIEGMAAVMDDRTLSCWITHVLGIEESQERDELLAILASIYAMRRLVSWLESRPYGAGGGA